ncbi:MAG: hypothetical protein WAJ93_09975, partial [Candidatus Nitrosopolaris sp.]
MFIRLLNKTIGKTKTTSKDDGLVAAKTRLQVDNAVYWLEKRYFTEEVRAKKQLNESAAHVVKANRNDKIASW